MQMQRRLIAIVVLCSIVLTEIALAQISPYGRWKLQGNRCVWDSNDRGPNQCDPRDPIGRWKIQGAACVWDPNDRGPNQCEPTTLPPVPPPWHPVPPLTPNFAQSSDLMEKQIFTGDRARAFLKELAETNAAFREAQEESAEIFTARGMKPADIVAVFQLPQRRSTDPGTGITPLNIGDTVRIQGFIASAWDDGYPGTWEGNMTWYVDGALQSSINTQFNLDNGQMIFQQPGTTTPKATTPTKTYDGVPCNATRYDIPMRISRNAWWNFAWRVAPTAGTCRWAGPGWFYCIQASAAINLVVAGLQELSDYARACG